MIDSENHNLAVHAFQEGINAFTKSEHSRAIALMQQAIHHSPELAEAHHALGVVYYCQSRLREAEQSIRAALSISQQADFYVNLGLVLRQAEDTHGAESAYRKALALNPASAKACNNLGNILVERQQFAEAIALYEQAIRFEPAYKLSYKNLAYALTGINRFEEASNLYCSIGAWGDAQAAMRNGIFWRHLPTTEGSYLDALVSGNAVATSPWNALLVPGMTPELELRAAREWVRDTIPEVSAPAICTAEQIDFSGRRLRVGYLSADFYNHATMHLLMGVLEVHDASQFDICIFSYSPRCEDALTARLHEAGIRILDVSQLSDEQAAREIAHQNVDILVDLKGHTKSVRLGITARRPAPIIVNWLGYPGTLGHPRLADYIIGDPVVTPAEDAQFYSERLALMPHCYQPNDRKRPLPQSMTRAAAGLPEQGVVFCCFNNAIKFNSQTLDIWCRLLAAVPDSVLWLLDQQPAKKRLNLDAEFRSRGVDAARIVYAPFLPQADHSTRLQLADIAIDTFPCTSHTTASDALWAGVPLVTRKGRTFASRVAASLLEVHGFPQLVTESADEYFGLALFLATNDASRSALKTSLNEARFSSPLFDTAFFTRNLEALYRAIVIDWVLHANSRPAVVSIS